MTRLKTVVLPEPFGPIRPVIDARPRRLNEQSSTATTPPKRLRRPSTSSSALTTRPTSFVCVSRGVRRVRSRRAAVGERRQDAPRQQQHHDQEDARVADEVELARPESVGEVLLRRHEDERAEHRPPDRAAPAEVDHQHHPDRDERVDGELRVDEGDVVRPDAAGHRDEPRRERERGRASRRSSARRARARDPRRRGSRAARARACCRGRTSSRASTARARASMREVEGALERRDREVRRSGSRAPASRRSASAG